MTTPILDYMMFWREKIILKYMLFYKINITLNTFFKIILNQYLMGYKKNK